MMSIYIGNILEREILYMTRMLRIKFLIAFKKIYIKWDASKRSARDSNGI